MIYKGPLKGSRGLGFRVTKELTGCLGPLGFRGLGF